MDTVEFEKLVYTLDLQLTALRKEVERRAKRETLERKLRQLAGQRHGLEQRLEEFARYGAKPSFDLEGKIAELKAEEAELERQLAEFGGPSPAEASAPVPAPREGGAPPEEKPAPEVDPALRMQVLELLSAIKEARLPEMFAEERWALFHVWALRWRILAEKIGQDVAREDREMKAAYAEIKKAMERHPEGNFFLSALHPRETGDWERQLEGARAKLQRFQERRERRREAEDRLEELRAIPARTVLAEDADALKDLIEGALRVAREPSLRDDLAQFLLPHRKLLPRELHFLWEDDEAADTGPIRVRLSNRRIVERLLRRMVGKALIGECHGPLERLYKGFPDHDQGRAKEALELLAKAGVLREKPTSYGRRVSIDTSWVNAVENFVAGRPLGTRLIDEWCEEKDSARALSG